MQGGSGLLAIFTGISNPVVYTYENGKTIDFKLLLPPKLSREVPTEFKAIIVNDSTKTAQYAVFKITPTDSDPIKNLSTSEKTAAPKTLSVHDYTGIRFPALGYSIYFENVKNLQFRGDRIWWIPDTNEYLF